MYESAEHTILFIQIVQSFNNAFLYECDLFNIPAYN